MALNPSKLEEAAAPPPVGATIQVIRTEQKLSLDALSKRSGVSKSMLSQIERNLTNPTVAILWKLANALNVSVAEILALDEKAPVPPSISLTPAHSTPVIKNVDGTCELRILGPVDLAGKVEWYELTIQPSGILASDPHEKGSKEHLTVLAGQLIVKAGTAEQKLKLGDTARYSGDIHHSITNPGKTAATALMVIEYAD